jgi:hypothetical protein
MKRALFALGQIVATPGALETMKTNNIDELELLHRHITGDWGDLDDADKQENELSVQKGFRILAVGRRRPGGRLPPSPVLPAGAPVP